MFERELRDAAFVHRWGILRRSRNQNIAEHMYFVAIYAMEIAEFIDWPGDRYLLMQACLTHDLPEIWSGDIPGPTKHTLLNKAQTELFENDQMHQIFPSHLARYQAHGEAKAILTMADRLEATMFLADEWNAGNKSVGSGDNPTTPFGSNVARLHVAILELPCVDLLKSALIRHVLTAIKVAADGTSRIYLGPSDEVASV